MRIIEIENIKILFKRPLFWVYSIFFWFIFYSFIFLISILSFVFENDYEYEYYSHQKQANIEANKELFLLEIDTKIPQDIIPQETQKEKYDAIINDLRERVSKKERELSEEKKVHFLYVPKSFEYTSVNHKWIGYINEFLFSDFFRAKELNFLLELYQKKDLVRGKFYDNTIRLYDLEKGKSEEILSVFIHELGHYFDIVYLEKKVMFDVSDIFYNISWESIYALKAWIWKKDFVSGYAMTNKYEDFAESFIYYMLFNEDFRQKSKESSILQKKYDFFSNKIFRNDEFKKTNFRTTDILEEYYWDTTKINFSPDFFLEYLKKWI